MKSFVIFAVFLPALLFSRVLSAAESDSAQDGLDVRYLHVMMGVLDADQSWTIEDEDDGSEASSDIDKLVYGGAVAQIGNSSGVFQYGFESGGLISFKNDTNIFLQSSEGGGVQGTVKVENQLWIMDFSIGAFASIRPWHGFRLYLSGGPALIVGSLSIDSDDVKPVPTNEGGGGTTINYRPSSRENDAAVGVYGRVGFDVILNNGFIIGASARRVDSELDFGHSGTIDFDDTQYFLTLGQAF